ncbi:MAG TPA: ribosome biogenesis GTPase Der [Limnobacter sp.]|uniref:ribosome biogenesis GTPase Der n=1 Tax=Limnobacter sp. TaxID=2003368 RepID=UPI002E2EFBDE|nr:ribosome biogenesis GTPase Der [Limnobacter sp.]HEX5486698.1 ribosome biogenesis GTPase Der [Limnobacter sp.]
MKPVIALVGRPNVGKSTLFNRLTRTRDALVANQPGLTRDRHYGIGRMGPKEYLVIDTGGLEPVAKEGIFAEMAKQSRQAIVESDLVLFIVDGRQGITPHDHVIAAELRKARRDVILVVNKTEGLNHTVAASDFYELGLGEPETISASHGDGVRQLMDLACEKLPELPEDEEGGHRIKVAIAGRPNVGKSTMVNTLLGEERVIAFDMPGTTRDSIYIDFERNDKPYTLIDTAGLRKRGKVFESVEKFSVIKTLQAIEDANVVILMLDAQQEISDQDASIAGFIVETGRALVLAVNKWDSLDEYRKERIKTELNRKLVFLGFARLHFVSATKPFGIGAMMRSVDEAHAAAFAKLSTPKLTRLIQECVEHQQPPRKGIFRPKLRYAHQGGQNPPIVVVHGTALDAIPDSYKRFLEGQIRDRFNLAGTPLRVEFRSATNPFVKEK